MQTSLALTSVSKALEVWAGDIEVPVQPGDLADVPDMPKDVKLMADFLAEASIDLVKQLARVMLWATTGRWALWLKPWIADPISEQAWCKIPFEGHSLFSDKLDTAIFQSHRGKIRLAATESPTSEAGKAGTIPQPASTLKRSEELPPGKRV